jgi:hypothetical protein
VGFNDVGGIVQTRDSENNINIHTKALSIGHPYPTCIKINYLE